MFSRVFSRMFSRILNSNYAVAALAFFIAFILWLFAAQFATLQEMAFGTFFEDSQKFSNVSVNPVNLDEGLDVSGVEETITVELKGKPEELKKVDDANLVAFINLKGVEPGEHVMDILLHYPENLSHVSHSPNTLTITVSEKQNHASP